MSKPKAEAAPPSGTEIPDFAELAADPEIAALLDFEPAVRKVKRPDGWSPELQRELIARMALTGAVQLAVSQMGKQASGAQALYKVAGADSFRAAWDSALALGRRRTGRDSGPQFTGDVPGIRRRPPRSPSPPEGQSGGEPATEGQDEDDDWSPDQKLAVLQSIMRKYLMKVRKEREARLEGRIVEADFTLRQITCVEIGLDLMAECAGMNAFELLKSAQRDGRNIYQIAETPFSKALDAERRRMWAELSEPARPEHPPERHLVDYGNFSVEPGHHWGALTPPAAGFSAEQWAALSYEQQKAARAAEFAQAAADQLAWEAKAAAEFEARRTSGESPLPLAGEG